MKTKEQLLQDLEIAKSNVDAIKSNLKQIELIEHEAMLKSYSHLVGKCFKDAEIDQWLKIITVRGIDKFYLYADTIFIDDMSAYISNNHHLNKDMNYSEIPLEQFNQILNKTIQIILNK